MGNCSTANILCKQFRTRWWRGSCSISSENGKIIERFKELLKKRWRDPRDNPCLCTSPQKSYYEIDTIPDALFCFVLLRSTFVQGSLVEYQCINSSNMVERELVGSCDI